MAERRPPEAPAAVQTVLDTQRTAWHTAQDAHVAQVLQRLEQMQRRLVQELAGLDPTQFARQAQALRRLVDELGTRFRTDATSVVQAGQRAALPLAQVLVDGSLRASGVTLALPELTVPLLETLLQFAADKVTGLSQDLVARVSTEIQLGVLGSQTPYDTMEKIRSLLATEDAGRTSVAARAEAITRTETGRVHSTATQRRLEQARRSVPDLQKEWIHGGSRQPRSGHVAAHGQRVPVDQPFLVAAVAGGTREALMHPRDPRGSARNTVNCRCDTVPWLARWAEAAA